MRFKKLAALVISLAVLGNVSFAASLPSKVGNYFIGYQSGLMDSMKRFDMSITDARNYTKEQVQQLKASGVTVIGYVSVGEEVGLEKGDGKGPGGYASWYFDANGDNKPDQNGEFASNYTNAANPLWVQRVVDGYAKEAFDKGVDGIFLDTVNTIEVYPQSKDGMINLIKKLRERYPDKIIIQNWGFNIAEATAPYINAVMWESWYPDSTDQWVINWQNKFKELKAKYGLDLITLGYYERYSNLERYYEVSKELGFIPYVDANQQRNVVVDFFSQRRVAANPAPSPVPQPQPVTSVNDTHLTALMEIYKPAGQAMLVGPLSETSGWSGVKSYYGMLHREARGWDAGVEFTVADKTKDMEVEVKYLDDAAGNLLGLSYHKWNSTDGKAVWNTTAVKKNGTGYVKAYKFVISKEAFVDTNPHRAGIQVLVGIGGLDPVDKIKSVGFKQGEVTQTAPSPQPTQSVNETHLLVYMEPNKPVGQTMLVGPISETSGRSAVKSYYGMLHREARGWDAGVEFTIADKTKNAEIEIKYLDDVAGNLLGLSYYKWDSANGKAVWSTNPVKKNGTGYVKAYKFVIPKEAFVDNNSNKAGIQVLVGVGGLDPVDKIKSVGLIQ